jgi:PAS domain S-box-containing protein
MQRSGISALAASFALAAAAAATTGLGAYWNARAVDDATGWVLHTREVQSALDGLLSQMKDVETGQRGYLLTADTTFLEPYEQSVGNILPGLERIRSLTADNPSQQQRLVQLRAIVTSKLSSTEVSIAAMRAGERERALQVVLSGQGKATMDDARNVLSEMLADENRLLGSRLRNVDAARTRASATAALTTVLLLVLITTVYASARRANARIQATLEQTEASRRELAFVQAALDRAAIVASSDAEGRLVQVNDAFVQVSGFPREDLLGKHHSVVSPAFDRAFYQGVREGRTWRGELRSRAHDGHEFWTDSTVVPLLDAQGRPERYIAIHYDITDRKQAEFALRDSESRYRTLTEALPHMVWTAAPDLTPTYFNSHWHAFTGTGADLPGRDAWLDMIHPDDRDAFATAVRPAQTAGEAHEAEFRLRRHDGQWRRVISRATPRRDEQGRIVQWVGTVTDIHDRRQAEQALHQSQALVQAIVDGSTALVFAKDLQGRYFLTNAAWHRFVGLTRDQAEGMSDREVFGDEVAGRLQAADRHVAESGEAVVVEETAVVGGREATYVTSKFPLRTPQGEVYAVCGVSTDVTDLKVARQEVQRLNADLERRVAERTRQLSEANDELEAFSYTVSHDLRAPLRGLQGFAQAVQEDYADRLDELGRDYLQRIMAAARRMEHLIQDLLEYGRLSRGEVPLRTVGLQMAVDEALAQVQPEVERRLAQVHVEGPLPPVRAHPTVLVQVVANLLGNALKFVPPGQRPEVRIRSERHGDRVRTCVQDRGIGIQPQHQERIFRVFERLHGQESYPGTGVGLGIVRKGCERMGGRCGVESSPGNGSTFWFELQAGGPA